LDKKNGLATLWNSHFNVENEWNVYRFLHKVIQQFTNVDWRLFCIDKSAPVTKTGRLCGGGLRESERLLPVVTQVEKGRRKKIVF